jgi:2-dehydro-3-deoxyphosphooctonate aldolase (KDO 8-P synthase)
MSNPIGNVELAPSVVLGASFRRSPGLVMRTASALKRMAHSPGVPLIFKASFHKANRTLEESFRSIGTERALEVLRCVRTENGLGSDRRA